MVFYFRRFGNFTLDIPGVGDGKIVSLHTRKNFIGIKRLLLPLTVTPLTLVIAIIWLLYYIRIWFRYFSFYHSSPLFKRYLFLAKVTTRFTSSRTVVFISFTTRISYPGCPIGFSPGISHGFPLFRVLLQYFDLWLAQIYIAKNIDVDILENFVNLFSFKTMADAHLPYFGRTILLIISWISSFSIYFHCAS